MLFADRLDYHTVSYHQNNTAVILVPGAVVGAALRQGGYRGCDKLWRKCAAFSDG
jgi:hypothetical protein